ncbi:hemolysin family protein [Streptantibioticus ferralitis]|uniref:Hemolysin family protein n=1 Tax=Streptantibioticus ferralitis TaxID=236510 RepID=A0ABT5ZCI2_9ACTN|nr:hemolysin family protein [Streptantibioticus ferralitis]MDF2261347.1 hemolysin family protein [Streptantibioticus ferralitis]
MIALQLFVGVLTLVANAFFVGAEFALVSVRRSQIDPLAERGDRRARSVLWGLEHVSALMATAQLGITVCTLVLGAVAEPAFAHLLEPAFHAANVSTSLVRPTAFVIALAAATYLHMLFGEMVPKNIALSDPPRAALALGPPLVALTRTLRPVILVVNALANAGLRLLRVEPRDEVAAAFSDAELARMVTDAGQAGLLDERATERLQDALELGRRPVGEVVLPAERVVSARLGITPEDLERLAASTGFSRFPVTDSAGRVLGYLHVKDALAAERRDAAFPVSALRPITRVRASTPLDDALTAMRSRRAHLAAVVDDEGRTVGLVTMEDVLRELVGQAPHDLQATREA